MGKKALIAEPDLDEARKQAAILSDDGYDVAILGAGDLLEELSARPVDVVILRHERPGQNGLALVQRIKRLPRFGGVAMVLTTSDLAPETIDKHRAQRFSAEAYVPLPLRRQDLLEAARQVPAVLEASDVAVEAPEPADPKRPPPVPPMRGWGLAMMRKGEGPALSSDDMDFVEDLFSSITESHAVAPPPLPVVARESFDGPDRKLELLRHKIREYEHQLARLKGLWLRRQGELKEAETRVEAKAIEVEGLHLRIRELEDEVQETNQTLENKIAEFGRMLGDQFDELNLREAELIQAVAGKEHEINKLKRGLKKTEEERDRTQQELTTRIFEWERAYQDFEAHHWQVVGAGAEELFRVEAQLAERDARNRHQREHQKYLESSLALEKRRHMETVSEWRREQHQHQRLTDELFRAADILFRFERRRRVEVEAEVRVLQLRVLDLEEALFRHARLLVWLDGQRRCQIAGLAQSEADRRRELEGVRAEWLAARAERDVLEQTLSVERALGEAALHDLFEQADKERLVADAQEAQRDRHIDRLAGELENTRAVLSDTALQLEAEQDGHRAQRLRGDEFAAQLAAVRESAAQTEGRLREENEGLLGHNAELDQQLLTTREALQNEKDAHAAARQEQAREQREAEEALAARDAAIHEHLQMVAERDRALEESHARIDALETTLSSKEERISDLSARGRQADEQIVKLESLVARHETQLAEQSANLAAFAEREEALHRKLVERDAQLELISVDRDARTAELRTAEKALDETNTVVARLHDEVALERQQHAQAAEQLAQTLTEVASQKVAYAELEQQLVHARAEIAAGAVMAEDLQNSISSWESRAESLRELLDEREAELSTQTEELSASHQELAQLQEAHGALEAELARVSSSHTALAGELSSRDAALSSAAEQQAALEAELSRVSASHTALAGELSSRDAAPSSAAEQQAALEAELSRVSASHAALAGELSSRDATFSSAAERDAEHAKESERWTVELSSRDAALEQMHLQMAAQQETHLSQSSAHEAEKAALHRQFAELQEAVAARDAMIRELQEQRSGLGSDPTVAETASELQAAQRQLTEAEQRRIHDLQRLKTAYEHERQRLIRELAAAQQALGVPVTAGVRGGDAAQAKGTPQSTSGSAPGAGDIRRDEARDPGTPADVTEKL